MKGIVFALCLLSVVRISFADGTSPPQYEDCSAYLPAVGGSSRELLDCAYRVKSAKDAFEAAQQAEQVRILSENMRANSPNHSADSYQRCVLKKVTSAQNDYAARVLDQECHQFPYYAKEAKSDFFGYSTAGECFGDVGGKPASKIASMLIKRACDDLFP